MRFVLGCIAKSPDRLSPAQVLTLSLKRFQYDQHTGRRSKIHKRCSFPMELDLGAFSQQSEPARYRYSHRAASVADRYGASCAAVVIHRGEAQSGHYHAFIKDTSDQGSWYQPTQAPGGLSIECAVAHHLNALGRAGRGLCITG